MVSKIYCINHTFSAAVYYVWQERNRVVIEHNKDNEKQVVQRVIWCVIMNFGKLLWISGLEQMGMRYRHSLCWCLFVSGLSQYVCCAAVF